MKSLRTQAVGLTAGCWIAKSMHAEPADGEDRLYNVSLILGSQRHTQSWCTVQACTAVSSTSFFLTVKREGRSTGEDETLGTSDWKEPREGIHTM